MAELEFNINDVTSLARKLSTVQGLTQQEHMLLLAIFAAAAAQAKVTNQATKTSTLPNPEVVGQGTGPGSYATAQELKDQLLRAYIPGNYFEDVNQSAMKTVGSRVLSAQAGNPPADEGGQPVT